MAPSPESLPVRATLAGRASAWVRADLRHLGSTVQGLARVLVSGDRATRSPPNRPGITSGKATLPRAEEDLHALATSPTVFAGITRLALGMTVYPIRCYRGFSMGGRRAEPLDPELVPWVAKFLRLLQHPDPASADQLFPEAGETLIAQIVADLRLTGNFFVAPWLSMDGDIVGLRRLHPQCCSIDTAKDLIIYRNGSEVREYPRRSVAHGHLLSWQRNGQGEMGTGAGTSLAPLVDAEATALRQTAAMVRQGGADLVVQGKGAAGMTFMRNPENRQKTVRDLTTAITAENGRRIMALSDELELKDSGLKPADLQAPAMLGAARGNQLVAIGVVPVAVGMESGTYATAVQQYRSQAEQDEGLASVIESALLRPLARHFARRQGGHWALRLDEVTARIDLSSHPGYAYLRTDAIGRMEKLQRMGWTAKQAGEIEGMDLPAPEGTSMMDMLLTSSNAADPNADPNAAPGTPGPVPGSHKDPRRPVGDGAPRVAASLRLLKDLFIEQEEARKESA